MLYIDKSLLDGQTKRKNLFSQLLFPSTPQYDSQGDKKQGYKQPTTKELLEEAITVMGGGVEEASNAMMYGIHYLMSTKGVYGKLKDELRQIWPDKEIQIRLQDLERSSYFVSPI